MAVIVTVAKKLLDEWRLFEQTHPITGLLQSSFIHLLIHSLKPTAEPKGSATDDLLCIFSILILVKTYHHSSFKNNQWLSQSIAEGVAPILSFFLHIEIHGFLPFDNEMKEETLRGIFLFVLLLVLEQTIRLWILREKQNNCLWIS